jgi:hypothetical protein
MVIVNELKLHTDKTTSFRAVVLHRVLDALCHHFYEGGKEVDFPFVR